MEAKLGTGQEAFFLVVTKKMIFVNSCEPPRLTVPFSDPIASPIPGPLLNSQFKLTGIQPQGGRPGATT